MLLRPAGDVGRAGLRPVRMGKLRQQPRRDCSYPGRGDQHERGQATAARRLSDSLTPPLKRSASCAVSAAAVVARRLHIGVDMRNGTAAAAAFVRSAMYRDVRRDVEPKSAPETSVQPRHRGRNGAETAWGRGRSRGSARLTLALLGLLDVLERG